MIAVIILISNLMIRKDKNRNVTFHEKIELTYPISPEGSQICKIYFFIFSWQVLIIGLNKLQLLEMQILNQYLSSNLGSETDLNLIFTFNS